MEVDSARSSKRTLRREVLPPLRQNTGVGAILVASSAMFFAMVSSAFLVQSTPRQSQEPERILIIERGPIDLQQAEPYRASIREKDCSPIIEEESGGTLTLTFHECR